MKKQLFGFLASLCILSTSCAAAPFEAKNTFVEGQFSDVSMNEWYYGDVAEAYELGFMNGVGDGQFSPEGTMTVAEAITLASRVSAIYHGESISTVDTGEWYTSYVQYAQNRGLIQKEQFDSYERPVKRYEMAELFYASVPEDYLTAVNAVEDIPDVAGTASYRTALLTLYQAGVVMGNDAYGSFLPMRELTRAEAAAIIGRVARPEKRLKKELAMYNELAPALYFIDDTAIPSAANLGQYGWEYDMRGLEPGSIGSTLAIIDKSTEESTRMFRSFAPQTGGRLVMETCLSAASAGEGFAMSLGDGSANAMYFVTKDGRFHAKEGDSLIDTGLAVRDDMTVKTVTDMYAKTNTLYADGKRIGSYGFCDTACEGVSRLTFESTKEAQVYAGISKTKLYTGYAVNDIFLAAASRDGLSDDWTVSEGVDAAVVAVNSNAYDPYSASLTVEKTTGTVKTAFAPIKNKVVFEMKLLMQEGAPDFSATLTSMGEAVCSISAKNNAFYADDGTLLRVFDPTVWQTLRLEVNTDTGVVTYSINHKRLHSASVYVGALDGLSLSLSSEAIGSILFDDVFVYHSYDEAGDYVPAPVAANAQDMHVGIEVCDIWRNGYQFGWDYTSAFEELHPYLGYYDEGSTEVADWEIKWLVEHGVDFKLACWYSGTPNAPVKTPRNSYGLTAQLNAKYTDQMKYAILWENSANLPQNAEQFRKNIVSYWKEYYLYDKDRYYSIDNKALIAIYRADSLVELFGSVEQAAAEIEYLREVCREIGYDDAIILACNGTNENLAAMGFDGRYAYNWGQNAFDAEYQKKCLTEQSEACAAAGLTSVPTVGVGFSNMYLGQGNSRSPLITPEDYRSLLSWVRDELLALRGGEDWQTGLVILSNWNEFGEGHYILPTDGIGFAYLDAIRSVFAADTAHNDARPDDLSRFTGLYDQMLSRMRRMEKELPTTDATKLEKAQVFDFSDTNTEQIFKNGHGNEYVEYTEGVLKGKSSGGDFCITTVRDMKLDASTVTHIRFVYKATALTAQTKAQLYFITEADKNWNEAKCVNFNITADGKFHEYLVDMTANALWKGTVQRLRLDPIERGDCEYAVQSMELLSDTAHGYSLYVNNEEEPTTTILKPEMVEGELYAAIDPYAESFYAKLGIFYRWNAAKGQLSLYGARERYIVFTVGSSKAQTSAGEMLLKAPITLVDGIPTICIDTLAKALEVRLEITEGRYRLSNYYLKDVTQDIVFDFDLPGYTDGFSISGAEVTDHKAGILSARSLTNGKRHDPVLASANIKFSAIKYEKITVRMAYETTGGVGSLADGISSTLFFAPVGGQFTEACSVSVKTPGVSSNGEFVDIVFDMTQNPNWTSTIGRIRFDPFEAEGSFRIDSIRVELTNPSGTVRIPEAPTEVTLDAEDGLPEDIRVYVENGTLSITQDPSDPDKKAFLVKTSASDRKWTYFNIFMHFEAGKKYKVSYRLLPLKDYAGNGYTDNIIGANFIFGNDALTVTDHTGGKAACSDTDSWKNVEFVYELPGDYMPSGKDLFQIWSNPANDRGVSYLVDDLSIVQIA